MEYENIELAKGDIRDEHFLPKAFQGCDGVFHVAAFAKPWAKHPEIYYEVNEIGTDKVCQAALSAGVRRLVYTASAGIHGPQQNGLINEATWPSTYHTDYEQSKYNGMQRALSHVVNGLEVVVVSPARVYAAGDAVNSNVPVRMMQMYLNNGFGVVPASGTGIGSYVFMSDIVNGHLLAMRKGVSGEEYLLGGDNLSYLQFFDVLKEVSGKSRPVIRVPYPISLGIGKINLWAANNLGIAPTITTPWVRRYLKDWGVDSSKIIQLGYEVTSLKSGIEKVFDGWRDS